MIDVLSLNCWKNEGDLATRLPRIADGLAGLGPHIACLQEVYADTHVDVGRALSAATGLPGFVHPMRTKDRGAGRSTAGLAVLTALPVRRVEALALPSNAEDGGRFAQGVDLDAPFGPLRVLNLHLTHLQRGEGLRAAQMEAALAWARTGWSGPILVAGDLNAAADSRAIAALFGAADLVAPPSLPADAGSLHHRPGWVIDHVVLLQAPGFTLERRLVFQDEEAVSDHAGVHARVAAATNR